jgi:hypothetical protein
MRTSLVLSYCLALMIVQAQQIEAPIDTRIDRWQPVLPGQWIVSSKRFPAKQTDASSATSTQTTASACPYSSLLFLRSDASVKLGEPGCQFRAYQLSKNEYHIVARCRTLSDKDHYETTTLTVSNEGKAFSSATTWIEPKGSITMRMEGAWSTACRKE